MKSETYSSNKVQSSPYCPVCLNTVRILKFPSRPLGQRHCQKYLLIVPILPAVGLFSKKCVHWFNCEGGNSEKQLLFQIAFHLRKRKDTYGEPALVNGLKQSIDIVARMERSE